MLDVSVRAGILNLMRELQDSLGLTAIYISHDLALVRYVARRTLVMYLGAIVEDGPTEEIIREPLPPLHPGAGRRGAAAARRPDRAPRCRCGRHARCPQGRRAAAASSTAARGAIAACEIERPPL